MIVNCPKCGFTQPKDKYCAKCGVDMEAYRPQKPPLATRVLKSWVFQSVVLLLSIGTALSFLRLQRNRDLIRENEIVQLTKPPPLPSGQAAQSAPAPPPPPPAAQAHATPPAAPSNANQVGKQNLASKTSSPGPQAAGVRAQQAMAPRAADANRDALFSQIDLNYAELPRTVLSNLEAGSRMLEADAIGVGIYPNIAPLMRQLTQANPQRARSLRVLDSARGIAVKINQPIVMFKGMRDQQINRNIGITTQITPTAMDENGLHVQIEVHRLLRDPNAVNGLSDYNYEGELSLTKGAGAFIAGLIPHRQPDAGERANYANSGVLKILTSQDFQEDLSEFVLLIEAR